MNVAQHLAEANEQCHDATDDQQYEHASHVGNFQRKGTAFFHRVLKQNRFEPTKRTELSNGRER